MIFRWHAVLAVRPWIGFLLICAMLIPAALQAPSSWASPFASLSTQGFTVRQTIASPRQVQEAHYRLHFSQGVPAELIRLLSADKRQQVRSLGGDSLALIVRRGVEHSASNAVFPVRLNSPYLATTDRIPASSPAIRQQATALLGTERNAANAARRLAGWVHQEIRPVSSANSPADVETVLQNRQGDAAALTALLVTLARSVGIPARLVAGLDYQTGETADLPGAFKPRAWAEIALTDARGVTWLALDPSRGESGVDATHIRLLTTVEGTAQELDALSAQLDRLTQGLQIEVVEAQSPAQSVIDLGSRPSSSGSARYEMNNNRSSGDKIDLNHPATLASTRLAIHRLDIQPELDPLEGDSAESVFASAMSHWARGEYGESLADFQSLGSQLRTPVEYYETGIRLANEGLFNEAEPLLQQAARLDGRFQPQVEAILTERFPTVRLDANQTQRFMEGVYLQTVKAQPDRANALFQSIADDLPHFAPIWLYLGDTFQEMGDMRRAVEAYRTFQATLPNDPRGFEKTGLAQLAQNQYRAATLSLQKAVSLARQGRSAPNRQLARDLTAELWVTRSLGTLYQDRNNVSAWLSLGKGLARQGKPDAAMQAFRNALLRAPSHSEALALTVQGALQANDWDGVRKYLPRLQQHSGSAVAHRVLGLYHLRTRHYEQARAQLNLALRTNPQDADAYGLLGDCESRAGQWQAAEATYHKGLLAVPASDVEGRNQLRLKLAGLLGNRKPQLAFNVLNEVLLSDPVNSAAYLGQGRICLRRGETEEGRRLLLMARSLSPNDPDILTALGDAYAMAGSPSDAAAYYRRALAIARDHVEANQSLRLLIAQQGWAVRKPPLFIHLTPDEHDLMVQLLRQETNLSRNSAVVFETLTRLADRQGKVDLEAVNAGDAASQVISDFERVLSGYRQEFSRMSRPSARLQYLFSLYDNRLQSLSLVFRTLKDEIPFVYSQKDAGQSAAITAAGMQKISERSQALKAELNRLLDRVQPSEIKAIKAEAGYDIAAIARQEASRLAFQDKQKELAGLKENKPDSKNPGGKPASGNLIDGMTGLPFVPKQPKK
jgi:tetratricopeptide (TPR) repeat protein